MRYLSNRFRKQIPYLKNRIQQLPYIAGKGLQLFCEKILKLFSIALHIAYRFLYAPRINLKTNSGKKHA